MVLGSNASHDAPEIVDHAPSLYIYAAVFLIASAILVSRRPDAFLNPQFWAEDGKVFYASAYNQGIIRSVFHPYAGYLLLLDRLVALCSLAIPLEKAPLVLNGAAVVIQVFPAVLMVSPRLSWIGKLPLRLLFGFLYLALPNTGEIHDNITNCQWHFAFLAFLILTASPAVTWIWRCFDAIVMSVFAVTGPFALMLFPFGALLWWKRRSRQTFVLLAILACGAIVQSLVLLFTAHLGRLSSSAGLGATPALFLEIIADHVFLGTIVGSKMLCNGHDFRALFVVAFGAAALWYAAAKGPLELQLFLGFAALVFVACLASPMTIGPVPAWLQLEGASGIRYWFLPMLAVVAATIHVMDVGTPFVLRGCAVIVLCVMSLAITHEWRDAPLPDLQFREYSRRFEHALPGAVVVIPLNPTGFSMELTKH